MHDTALIKALEEEVMTDVSIIVPVYNAEATVENTIRALLDQDYKGKYEIIFVDDDSTDRTTHMIMKYDAVKLVTQEHGGPARARNRGAKVARGDTLVFTDADCVPEDNWLSNMMKPLEKDEIDGVQGAFRTRQKSVIARFVQQEIEDRYTKMQKEKFIDFVSTYSAAYRKIMFLEEGGFDETFTTASGEDTELSYRLASKGHLLFFNPGAIVYHTHPDNLWWYLKMKAGRAYWRTKTYGKHAGRMVKDSYTPQVLKLQIGLFYLFAFGMITSALYHPAAYTAAGSAVLLFVSSLPFSLRVMAKDFFVGLISPIMVFLRSGAFAYGLLNGILRP